VKFILKMWNISWKKLCEKKSPLKRITILFSRQLSHFNKINGPYKYDKHTLKINACSIKRGLNSPSLRKTFKQKGEAK